MSVFSSEKAPYVLALLVGVVGWFFSNAVTETRKRVFLAYEVSSLKENGMAYLELTLNNESIDLPFENVTVELRCPPFIACLTDTHPRTNGAFVTPIANPPWTIPVAPDGTAESQMVAPRVPAGASFKLLAGLEDDAVVPDIYFGLPEGTAAAPQISEGPSLYGFVFRNYLLFLVGGGVAGLGIFIVWAWNSAISGGSLKGGEPSQGSKETGQIAAESRSQG